MSMPKYVALNDVLYVKHKHQQRVRFVQGVHKGKEGWLIRKNGSMQNVMLEDGRYLSASVGDLEDVDIYKGETP